MKKILCLCVNLLLAMSCRMRPADVSNGQVIIGDNDLREVTDPKLRSAVGKFTDFCTGFHVGGGLIVTAGHCLAEVSSDGQSLGSECNEDLYFEWEDYLGGTAAKMRSSCMKVIVREESPERDFALIEVSPVPSAALEVDLGEIEPIGPGAAVEALSMPKSYPLSTSGPCTLIGPDIGSRYFHDCDTSDGSSGAPVLSASGLVIGVHNRGSKSLKKNSLTLMSGLLEVKEALASIGGSAVK